MSSGFGGYGGFAQTGGFRARVLALEAWRAAAMAPLGPWYRVNLAASLANSVLEIQDAGIQSSRLVLPAAGYFRAITIRASADRTAGQAVFELMHGTGTDAIVGTANLNTASPNNTVALIADVPFAATDTCFIRVTTSSTWLPTTADILALAWISIDPNA
jgi:hypothetical protein